MELNNKFCWKDIDGWFNWMEIYEEITKKCKENDVVLEIGSLFGRSSCYLASRCKMAKKNLEITIIDEFKEIYNKEPDVLNKNKIYLKLIKDIASAGVSDMINIIQSDEKTALDKIKKQSIFAVILERSENIEKWREKIRPGGILVCLELTSKSNLKDTKLGSDQIISYSYENQ